MKTDDLIDVLSTNFEAADRGRLWRALAGALTVGGAVAFGAMLVVLGARADAIDTAPLAFILTKLLFTLSVIAIATILLIKCARPMAERHKTLFLLVVPFVAIAIGAVLTIVSAPWLNWGEMIFGEGMADLSYFYSILRSCAIRRPRVGGARDGGADRSCANRCNCRAASWRYRSSRLRFPLAG